MVLATHDKEVINNLERRVITLDKGRLIRDEKKGKYILGIMKKKNVHHHFKNFHFGLKNFWRNGWLSTATVAS